MIEPVYESILRTDAPPGHFWRLTIRNDWGIPHCEVQLRKRVWWMISRYVDSVRWGHIGWPPEDSIDQGVVQAKRDILIARTGRSFDEIVDEWVREGSTA